MRVCYNPCMELDNEIRLSRGVRLGYARYGRHEGRPAFYFHGLPGSRREGILLHQACLAAGVQLIAPDRPGYGQSTPLPGHRLADWPLLIDELADCLEFPRFYLFAASGGAPYALVCASRLRERVLGCGICCGLAEVTRSDLRTPMSRVARLGFWLAGASPTLLRISYGGVLSTAASFAPRFAIDVLGLLQGSPDRAVLRQPHIRAVFAENLREAFRQGPAGGVADLCAAREPWPFDPAGIASLQLWHGDRDRVVPLMHSEWLARTVPDTRFHRVAAEGHFSLPIRYAAAVVQAVVHA